MTNLEKQVRELKIRVDTLEQFLASSHEMPVLGPTVKPEYDEVVTAALKKADEDLTQ